MQGVTHLKLPRFSVTLGMSRLKIVDQADFEVPYDYQKNLGVVLVFNGEIYNWRELRTELGSVPVGGWTTQCDAEVLAAAWRRWGQGCLDHLNGMWGLILADMQENIVFVARDRAGEKPLYWAERHEDIGVARYYASEIKALPVELRECECPDAVTLEFDASEETQFEGVQAVPPGVCFVHTRYGQPPSRHKWWVLPAGQERVACGNSARSPVRVRLIEELTELLRDAILIRSTNRETPSVPMAIQLSGGLDSAIVQAVCQHAKLYCVDFSAEGIDNLSKARLASQGACVTPVTFSYDDLVRELSTIAYYLDTPATWTAACQWFLNQKIAEDGGVVVLSGEGADELFGGYARYRVLYWLGRMYADPRLANYAPLIHRVVGTKKDVMVRMLDRSGSEQGRNHALDLIAEHGQPNDSMIDEMASTDFYTTMQVLLRMADRMSAAFSLENRSPFLDHRVMEFASTLPLRMKITQGESKSILRRVAERLGVHERIIGERTKRGLFVPSTWGTHQATWDRKWFASMMQLAWRESCCRPAWKRVE